MASADTPVAPPRAPYIRGAPLIGVLPAVRRDPLRYLALAAARHGPIVGMHLGPVPYHLLTGTAYIKHVLHDKPTVYQKSVFYEKMWPAFGHGLVTAEGEVWRRHRRTIQPVFRRERLSAICGTIAKSTAEMLERWTAVAAGGSELDMASEMSRLTETILLRALFAESDEAVRGAGGSHEQDWVVINEEIGRRFFAFTSIFDNLPFGRAKRFNDAVARRHALVDQLIAERRAREAPGEDMLGMLVAAKDEETGNGMTDQEIRDEVMTMFFAGHETTALALAWFWYLVPQHPEVLARVQVEAEAVLSRADTIDDEVVSKLSYTRMVLQEVMRLYPPVPWFSRTPTEDDTIDGYAIPAGSVVSIIPWVMHRHPDHWPDPEQFDPERFSPGNSANRDRLAYLPFGAGPRQCIGTHFAMMEATLVAALVARAYAPAPVPGADPEPTPLISLRPVGGVRVTLKDRRAN